jgi:hypothetical protein
MIVAGEMEAGSTGGQLVVGLPGGAHRTDGRAWRPRLSRPDPKPIGQYPPVSERAEGSGAEP